MKLGKSETVVDRLLEEMEHGTCPWRRPWSQLSVPRSWAGRPYHGVNLLILTMWGGSPCWLTYDQARKAGGHVKKGEKATPVTFWKILQKTQRDPDTHEITTQTIPLLRTWPLFNIDQCEGLEPPTWMKKLQTATGKSFTPIEQAEAIVAGWQGAPEIRHGGDRACYVPSEDVIRMPHREQFESPEAYYQTLFHELVHATGHKDRLNRGLNNSFGDHNYSKEELIAEIGAAFLMARCGLDSVPLENAAAYLRGWAGRISADKALIIMAGSAARKAAEMIVGAEQEETADVDENTATAA